MGFAVSAVVFYRKCSPKYGRQSWTAIIEGDAPPVWSPAHRPPNTDSSREQIAYDPAMYVGQAEVASRVAVRELLVIEA